MGPCSHRNQQRRVALVVDVVDLRPAQQAQAQRLHVAERGVKPQVFVQLVLRALLLLRRRRRDQLGVAIERPPGVGRAW
jgi:hypothetical protein